MKASEDKDLLHRWVAMADHHWKTYLPKKYKELVKDGRLQEALQEAAQRTANEVDDFLNNGFPMRLAEEIVLPRYILLDPRLKEAHQQRSGNLLELAQMLQKENEALQEQDSTE